jgi:hypothetical protein
MRNRQRKTRRKTRLRRLNIGAVSEGEHFSPEPLPLDWQAIETAYGHQLNPAQRQHLEQLIRIYHWLDDAEHNAFYLRDAVSAVCQIDKSVAELFEKLAAGSESAKHALFLVDQELDGRGHFWMFFQVCGLHA